MIAIVAAVTTVSLTFTSPAASAATVKPAIMSWGGWDNTLGAPPAGFLDPSQPLAVTSWGPSRLDIFGVGKDHLIHHRAYNGVGWTGWDNISLPPSTFVPASITAISWGPGRIDLFSIGDAGRVWHTWYQDGFGWGSWDNQLGIPPDTRGNSVSVSAWAPGRLDVFDLRQDTHIDHITYTTAAGWGTWDSYLSLPTPPSYQVAAASWGPNRIDLLNTYGGATYHTEYQSGAWGGWDSYLGTPPGGTWGAPAMSSWGPEELDVFEAGPDSSIWWREYLGSGVWTGWTSLGMPAGGTGFSPTAVSWGPNRIDLFANGTDGRVHHKAYAAS